ncbi:hypothetical protein EJ02DRAFT_431920 [Clathrospora elynae]|uniref:Uncharacterized protein n=1 Tax=Clathrospora elynae TaxID=706981 RepID=A0A6A5T2X0_9PLEO|nr:hypothetical protein EJ02DRAFT_431920 [Clathrospora elynae]
MVYFEQHVVLPSETQQRVDALLNILNALYHKLPDLSEPIDMSAAVNALKSIEKTSANIEPMLRRIDDFNYVGKTLADTLSKLVLLFAALVIMNMVLCYLVWKKSGTTGHAGCQCGRGEGKKLK